MSGVDIDGPIAAADARQNGDRDYGGEYARASKHHDAPAPTHLIRLAFAFPRAFADGARIAQCTTAGFANLLQQSLGAGEQLGTLGLIHWRLK